jgi:hypothetical protein
MTPTEPEPDVTPASGPPDQRPAGRSPVADAFAFFVAVFTTACRGTLEALGWGYPLRIPVVVVVWMVTCAWLGLPRWVLNDPSWRDIYEYGEWRRAAWVAAIVEVGGLFIFQVIFAGPRVARARQAVPQVGIATLLRRGEALYATTIASDNELKAWMERVKTWTALCERELSETLSPQEADAFRRPSVIQVYKHQQRFNDTHNGWLDLLSKRLDALRNLSVRLRPTKHLVQDPEPRA